MQAGIRQSWERMDTLTGIGLTRMVMAGFRWQSRISGRGATRNVADQNKFPVLADGRTESVNVVQAADGTVTLWAHAEGPSGYTKAAVVSIYGKPGGEFNTKDRSPAQESVKGYLCICG